MKEQVVYLDSSSLVKRYITEVGTENVDKIYDRSQANEIKIAFNIWNIGEAIGVFDRYFSRNLISYNEFVTAKSDMISETLKLIILESLPVFL